MEVEIVIEGNYGVHPPMLAKPCNCVSANGKENESHVELQGLRGSLGSGEAVAHDLESCSVAVLNEFPRKEHRAHSQPKQHYPCTSPIRSK